MTTDFAAAGSVAGFAETAAVLAATGAAGFAAGADLSLLGMLIPLAGWGTTFLAGVATVVGSLCPSSAVTSSCPVAKRSSGFLDSAFQIALLASSGILLLIWCGGIGSPSRIICLTSSSFSPSKAFCSVIIS